MPIVRVEVNEYHCVHCGYKWINRVNGKDGPVPDRCAKCKRTNWDEGSITPREVGLHKRIRNVGKFYQIASLQWPDISKPIGTVWDEQLVEQFLNLYPRPTRKELEDVLSSKQDSYSSEFKLTILGAYGGSRTRWGNIEDPDRPGYAKRDIQAYTDLLVSEGEKRKELMRQAIRGRGLEPIDSSPDHVPWHNPDDAKLASGILKLGKQLEEAGTVPKHKICAKLVKGLSDGIRIDKSDVERLCPSQWKEQEKAKDKNMV